MVASGVLRVEGGILKEKVNYIPSLSMSNKKERCWVEEKMTDELSESGLVTLKQNEKRRDDWDRFIESKTESS